MNPVITKGYGVLRNARHQMKCGSFPNFLFTCFGGPCGQSWRSDAGPEQAEMRLPLCFGDSPPPSGPGISQQHFTRSQPASLIRITILGQPKQQACEVPVLVFPNALRISGSQWFHGELSNLQALGGIDKNCSALASRTPSEESPTKRDPSARKRNSETENNERAVPVVLLPSDPRNPR